MKKYLYSVAFVGLAFAAGAQNVGVGTTAPLYPFHVVSAVAGSNGVFDNANFAGDALTGFNSGAAGTGTAAGVYGLTGQVNNLAAGVYGQNVNGTGTGIIGTGNGISNKSLTVGSGGAFTGTSNGLVGFANTVASGTGVIGAGNNTTPFTLNAGSGGAFTGTVTGLYANTVSLNGGTANQAIYTFNTVTGTAVAVNYYNGSQQFKILGAGSVSTVVKDLHNRPVIMYAPESPEVYFQDFGEGQLSGGRAHITIDPVLAKNIMISDKHPLRVFIQAEGDCKGVYVTNKTAAGFDVVELNNGHSDTPFQWSITCNRADEPLANGHVSKNADARFAPMAELPLAAEASLQPGASQKKLKTSF